ncbi:Uncharacterized protein OBRU01_10567, partial [Operophtera brumata]
VSKMCPREIEIACHNSADSCTISGPADAMKTFVSELVAKGIFAKEVPCSNIAYHSRYIAKAVIKTPKARSDKWVSTSVPQDRWEEEAAKFSSAEYHTNNLLSPVLFEETSKLIPSNAVLVEIAPHGLLQAILKRSLPDSCTNIPLTRRGHTDSPRMILEAVGKLYMKGYNPKVQVLYPKVEFPVSTGTPFLSYVVDWVHRKTQLPFSYALVAAWDTLAMTLNVPRKQLSVVFSDVHFHAQPVLHDQQSIKLVVSMHRGSGQFEIMDGNFKVATGFINRDLNPIQKPDVKSTGDDSLELNSRDVYQLFYERDYAYSGAFRSIHKANESLTEAYLLWNDNWVTFIDGMLQLNALRQPHNAVSEPSQITSMFIDVKEHLQYITNKYDTEIVKAHVSVVSDLTRCGGILMKNLKFHDLPPSIEKQVDLKTLRFVPRFQSNIDTFTSLLIFTQIVAENINNNVIKIVGIDLHYKDFALFEEMKRVALVDIPGIRVELKKVIKDTLSQTSSENIVKEADLLLVQDLSNDDQVTQMLQHSSCNDVFLINDNQNTTIDIKTTGAYKIVSALTNKNNGKCLELIRFRPAVPTTLTTSVIACSEKDFPSLIAARSKLSPQNSLLILSSYPPFSGLKNLVKEWRKDSSRNNINLIMVNDTKDSRQLAISPGDLAYGILDNAVWGGEYYLPLEEYLEKDSDIILRSEVIGNLESLKWVQAPASTKSGVLVKVHYAGINKNDILRSSGVIRMRNENSAFGMEFSGVTKSGERVMGLVSNGAAQSHVIAQPDFIWPVPLYWTLEDAATIPLAYVYAYYCLHIKVTKVGKEEDIGNSREASFTDMVLRATGGIGCDIVVCCLKGDLKNTYDTFRIHNQENFTFGMHLLTKDRTYTQVDISSIFFKPKVGEVKYLQTLVSEGIASGAVRPLSRVTYDLQEVSRAFHLLAASRVIISEETNSRTTLEDLGIQLEKSQAISSFLRDVHNISIDEEVIPSLSVHSINQIEEKTIDTKFEDVEGLGSFFSFVDPDELLATTELVFLPTLTNSSTMRDDECGVNQTYICIVPGLEGHHERFRSLCERLKLPALVLQPGLGHLQETIEELALRYSKVHISNLKILKC